MTKEFEVISRYRRGESKRAISRDMGLDRKTVRRICDRFDKARQKIDAAEDDKALEVATEQLVLKRQYNSTTRTKRTFTPEVEARMNRLIEEEQEKTRILGSHKQALTAVAVTEILQAEGYAIKYRTVAHYWAQMTKKAKEAFIRQDYALGSRVEFDFGEVKLEINGHVQTYFLAVFASPASDYFWAYLYAHQKKEVFQEAHVRFFEQIGGVYREVVYDNMRHVVSRFIGRNEKTLNPQLIQFATYYGFDINVTNCFSGNEKGTVEGRVKKVRQACFTKTYQFACFEAACDHLEAQLHQLNQSSRIEEEKATLLPYQPPFELAELHALKVNSYSAIHYQTNQYSVPDYLVGHTVQVKAYPNHLVIYANDQEVARHTKIEGSHGFCLDIYHYIQTFQKKPGALKHSHVLKHHPLLKTLYDHYYNDKPKLFLEHLERYRACDEHQRVIHMTEAVRLHATKPLPKGQDQEINPVIQQTEHTLHQLNRIFGLEETPC